MFGTNFAKIRFSGLDFTAIAILRHFIKFTLLGSEYFEIDIYNKISK